MVNLKINDIPVSIEDGSTILDAARKAHVHIPHLCYLKDINEIGACRVCSVEVKGEERLIPACESKVYEGMEVQTDTEKVRRALRANLSFILSQHKSECTYCVRSGNCQLQALAEDYNIKNDRYLPDPTPESLLRWNKNFPLIRDASKCIKCLRCIQICEKVQGLGVWDLVSTGGRATVDVKNEVKIEESACVMCGQCITHCPVGALSARDDIREVARAIDDKDTITVFQFAPAIRNTWYEEFGIDRDVATEKRLVGILKKLGADYVFDTSFAADLTIMEEGTEFIKRFSEGKLGKYPMFTSCCPGWVKMLQDQFPNMVDNLSTAKSPQQMFGAIIKSYFAEKNNIDPAKIKVISIMPCVAKKYEADLESNKSTGYKDVDHVLTTRELVRLIKSYRIHPHRIEEADYDPLMGEYSGAAVIFGATGGVMEAALRTAYFKLVGKNPSLNVLDNASTVNYKDAKWIESSYDLNGTKIKVAVASGLNNAITLCKAIEKEKYKYDFVEVMACPGGCSGGGGQPIHMDDIERAEDRGKILHDIDKSYKLRYSHENTDVQKLYNDYLKEPLGEKSEHLLHKNQHLR